VSSKFQGFNWESWRRQWYLELAPKAADLSHSGITAVWFPPPTESVAPQGLFNESNLNCMQLVVIVTHDMLCMRQT